jgi:hypothetical protein
MNNVGTGILSVPFKRYKYVPDRSAQAGHRLLQIESTVGTGTPNYLSADSELTN